MIGCWISESRRVQDTFKGNADNHTYISKCPSTWKEHGLDPLPRCKFPNAYPQLSDPGRHSGSPIALSECERNPRTAANVGNSQIDYIHKEYKVRRSAGTWRHHLSHAMYIG